MWFGCSRRATWLAAALLSPACAAGPGSAEPTPAQVQVTGRSHNRSDVDVYLLCGQRDARWLGVISPRGTEAFALPAGSERCVRGLNFFLVSRRNGRGYWVGPVRPRSGAYVELVVERYAGLSAARVIGHPVSVRWGAAGRD